jgi:hypothetical protein
MSKQQQGKIIIYRPKADGTYVVEFQDGRRERRWRSQSRRAKLPCSSTSKARIPYGLVLPDVKPDTDR